MKKIIILTVVGFALSVSISACKTSKRAKCDAYSQNSSATTIEKSAK